MEAAASSCLLGVRPAVANTSRNKWKRKKKKSSKKYLCDETNMIED